MELSGVGVWSGSLRYGDRAERETAAAELESLGYTTVWVPGGAGGPVFDDCRVLLEATPRIVVATGILNVWMHDATDVAAEHHAITTAHPQRFLLGLGISHSMLVDAQQPGRYSRPLATMRAYLDALRSRAHAGATRRASARRARAQDAELARPTRGAHPYLANPDHTKRAGGSAAGRSCCRSSRWCWSATREGARARPFPLRDLPAARELHQQPAPARLHRRRPRQRRQ